MASLPHGIAALLTAVLLLGGVAAQAQFEDEEPPPPVIYKWVDENGIAHYTTDRDRIPRELRDRFVPPERKPARTAPPSRVVEPATPEPAVAPGALEAAAPGPASSAPEAAGPGPEPSVLEATAPEPELAPPAPGAEPAPPEPPVAAAVPARPDSSGGAAAATPSAATPAAARPAASPRRRTARSEDWAAMDRRDEAVAERDLGGGDFAAADAGATSAEDLDERIRLLEAEIQADEEVLKALLSAPGEEGPLAIADDPELRAIAQRLPDRLKDLQALRDERGAGGADGASETN